MADTEQQGIPETIAMSALLLGCLEEREALERWWEDLVPIHPPNESLTAPSDLGEESGIKHLDAV